MAAGLLKNSVCFAPDWAAIARSRHTAARANFAIVGPAQGPHSFQYSSWSCPPSVHRERNSKEGRLLLVAEPWDPELDPDRSTRKETHSVVRCA